MGGGALWRDNQQSTFAHIHTSSIHSTNSTWSPIPYPHCVSTDELPRDLPPTKPLTDLYLDLLRPFLPIAAGSMHLVVIVDRFFKMTRMNPFQRIDAGTISAAFLDNWVAAYGPPATVLSDNGPQFRVKFFRGVCSLLGNANRYSSRIIRVILEKRSTMTTRCILPAAIGRKGLSRSR